jgi:hypothetical protein
MTTPTLSEKTTETNMLPLHFVPPLLNPAPGGLAASTSWVEEAETRAGWPRACSSSARSLGTTAVI